MGQMFDLGTVLSITSGKLLTSIDNVYKILNFMTGDSLYTHQLPRAGRQCEGPIKALYPKLVTLSAKAESEVTTENWKTWLANAVEEHGDEFDIVPLLMYTKREPLSELAEMVDPDKIIVVAT